MDVIISEDNEEMVAVLDGDIDHHTAKDMRETIDSYVSRVFPKLLKIDFGKIQFMDSSGIGLIMGRYKLMCSLNGRLKVINIPKKVERMVKLSGLTKLGIFEDEHKKR